MCDHLECELPDWLYNSITAYIDNKDNSVWDCYYDELQSEINIAEVGQFITSEQAWYLREKYLGLRKEDCT